MTRRGHARYADDVGAYLLGALDDDERAKFEKHLSRCDECREAAAELTPAVDALQHSVDPVEPPAALKTSVMAAVRAEPRPAEVAAPSRPARATHPLAWLRVRPRVAALAASALVALAFAGGALVTSLGGDDATTRTIAADVDAERQPAASARLVVPQNGGGDAVLRATGMQQPPPGRVYTVWLKRGERLDAVSLLAVDREGSASAALPGSVEGADAVLVTREPEGGSDRPSEAPVVSVDLAG